MKDKFNDVSSVKAYHAHIYFEEGQQTENEAREITEAVKCLFAEYVESAEKIGLVGPHTAPNYAVHLTKEGFSKIVPWLQLNNRGLSILIHPDSGEDVKDHLGPSMWLGTPVPYNDKFFAKLKASRKPELNP